MLEVIVCTGGDCHDRGSFNIVQTLVHLIEHDKLRDKVHIKTGLCMKKCDNDGVSIRISDEIYNVKPEETGKFYKEKILSAVS